MTDTNIPAPSAESSEPAAEAKTDVASAADATPQAEKPAGTDEQQTADQKAETPEGQEKKEPTPGELKRKARNRERWRNMVEHTRALEKEVARLRSAPEPDYTQYQDPNDELAAKTAHHVRKMAADETESRLKEDRSKTDEAMREAWAETIEEARSRLPDFDQVVTDRTPIHARAAPFLVESDKGAEIAYFLGKNPQAAVELFDAFESNPARALIQLGRIEAQLSTPAPKPVSTAPKPPSVLSGGISPPGFDAAKASVSDTEAYLRKAGIIR